MDNQLREGEVRESKKILPLLYYSKENRAKKQSSVQDDYCKKTGK